MRLSRWKNLLTILMMCLMFGASSQAAVCELACELEMQVVGCHAGAEKTADAMQMASASLRTNSMSMDHADCPHAVKSMASHAPVRSMAACGDLKLGGSSIVSSDQGGSHAISLGAVQWVVIGVVAEVVDLPERFVGVAGPVFRARSSGLVDPLVLSLRV